MALKRFCIIYNITQLSIAVLLAVYDYEVHLSLSALFMLVVLFYAMTSALFITLRRKNKIIKNGADPCIVLLCTPLTFFFYAPFWLIFGIIYHNIPL